MTHVSYRGDPYTGDGVINVLPVDLHSNPLPDRGSVGRDSSLTRCTYPYGPPVSPHDVLYRHPRERSYPGSLSQ